MKRGIKIIVNGLVQGVGYRYYCYRKANEFDIKGYTKNLPDGSVVIEAEGEKSMLNEFVKQLRIGPMNSNVKSVIIEELDEEKYYQDFRIY
jgi:acylphosphatase